VLVTVKRGDYDKLKAVMDIPATLIAPYTKGQQVGTLRITLAGQPVHRAVDRAERCAAGRLLLAFVG
jgi:hypothetical protein